MIGRSTLLRVGSLRPENLGQHVLAMFGNLCFTTFVVGVVIFTIIVATYESEKPLSHPSDKISSLDSDNTVVGIGEDFLAANHTAFNTFISITNVADATESMGNEGSECEGEVGKPIDCRDPEVFHAMMRAAIEKFMDIHFNRFGKPIRGSDDNTCDMAWWFRPKEGKTTSSNKDYRRFVVLKSANCSLSVTSIGDYHSGVNARKKKPKLQGMLDKAKGKNETSSLPIVGELVNDSLPIVESEESFKNGKYLYYSGGGDRCKSMNHYLWSFSCALGEAQYLNRTLVMDMSICLASMYTKTVLNEEGKDFRFYFDFEHLKETTSVLDQIQFWTDWTKWHRKNGLSLHLIEDFRVTPMKLKDLKDTLIIRKFGDVEPDNYWYRVCEGEAGSIIQRPWHMLQKSKRLMDIVSAIATKLNLDYDSVHVVRGKKAANRQLWPNLDRDTLPDALISTLKDKIGQGRNLYIATNEPDKSFFEPLKDKYKIHYLDEYKDLWEENSAWYSDTSKLNNKAAVEFDGYMRISVDSEVFLRGKTQLETFNDLTRDCKDGINTCSTSST